MSNEKKGWVVPKHESVMFSLAAFGQGMIYAAMSNYISDYYTNVLFLPHMFVFLLMLLARIWDAINDPLMGMIVDRNTTKWGKMKPYIVIAALPIAILTFLMFWTPESLRAPENRTMLMAYCAVVYTFWGMVYTMGDVPFWSFPNVMTPNAEERGSIISITKIFNSIGSALPIVIFAVIGFIMPNEANDVEIDRKKYLILAVIAAVAGVALYASAVTRLKERVIIPNKRKAPGDKSALMRIFTCKPLMLVIIMGVFSSGRYLMSAAAPHVARYAFEGQDYNSVYTVLQVCSAAGLFGTMLFMPALMKKFDYKKIVIFTCLAGFIASIVTTLVGWFGNNFFICAPFVLLQCIPLGVLNVVTYAMICDSLDYMELKTGFRDNALGSACQGFINKLGNALATASISLVYMAIGLDPATVANAGAAEGAILTVGQRFGMFSLISIVPGVCMLLCVLPMIFYTLSKKETARINKELARARAERGIIIDGAPGSSQDAADDKKA